MIDTIAVLAGGLGTRLGTITEKIPKSLVPVLGEPFIFHQLRLFKRSGIARAVFLIGHMGEQIVDAVGDGSRFGVRVEYVFDGPELLGTGGAIAAAADVLGSNFLMVYGDSYLECDYQDIAQKHMSSGKKALMAVYENAGAWDTSNIELLNGEVVAHSKENPTSRMRHIDYGVGAFSKTVFDTVSTTQPTDLSDIYARLAQEGQLTAYQASSRFYEIGSELGISDLERHLKS